jgi:hypothetical protein
MRTSVSDDSASFASTQSARSRATRGDDLLVGRVELVQGLADAGADVGEPASSKSTPPRRSMPSGGPAS